MYLQILEVSVKYLTGGTFHGFIPLETWTILFCILTCIIVQFISANIIGEMCSVLEVTSYTKTIYAHRISYMRVRYHCLCYGGQNGIPIMMMLYRLNNDYHQIDLYINTTLLEKYQLFFFFAKTWWILMKRVCMRQTWTFIRIRKFFPTCQ